jgi:hypothetical protein
VRVQPVYVGILVAVIGLFGLAYSFVPPQSADYCQAYHAAKSSPEKRVPDFWETTWCDPISYFTFWITGFTGLLALVSFVQLRGLNNSNEAARRAADAAKLSAEALVSAERAHVFIEIVSQDIERRLNNWAASSDAGSLGDDAHLSGTTRFFVEYRFRNHGKTPAVLWAVADEICHLSELPEEPRYFPRNLPVGRVIAAGQASEPITCFYDPQISVREARSITAGNSAMWFMGHVIYNDVVTGAEHTEPFLWSYTGDGLGFRADYRPAYNQRT